MKTWKRDLTEQRFGFVIVKKYLFTNKQNRAVWLCLCDCGNTVELDTHKIKRNSSTSCGCIAKRKSIDRIIKVAYKDHVKGARDRKFGAFLTKAEYIEIALKPCVYCGDFSLRKNPDTGDILKFNSVDRINNEKFYSLENTQSTCFICQRMKSDMSDHDFVHHIAKFQRKLNKKAP